MVRRSSDRGPRRIKESTTEEDEEKPEQPGAPRMMISLEFICHLVIALPVPCSAFPASIHHEQPRE